MELRAFDGDLAALRRLGEAASEGSSAHDAGLRADRFDPALLRALFARVPKDLLLGAYEGGELVGFVANLPRVSLLGGEPVFSVLACLLAVRPDFRRRGAALALARESERRAREHGARLALLLYEPSGPSGRLAASLARAGFPLAPIKDLQALGRVLRGSEAADALALPPLRARRARGHRGGAIGQIGAVPGVLREYEPEDLPGVLALVNAEARRAELGRLWTEEELAGRLAPDGAGRAVVYERAGAVAGAVGYTLLRGAGSASAPWAWLEHAAMPEMNPWERSALVKRFLHRAREEGCAGAVEWTRGCYPPRRLWLDGFFRLRARLRLSARVLDPALRIGPMRRVYEEVR